MDKMDIYAYKYHITCKNSNFDTSSSNKNCFWKRTKHWHIGHEIKEMWIQMVQFLSICCVLKQDTLSMLLDATQLTNVVPDGSSL